MTDAVTAHPIVHILAGDLWGGKEAQVLTQLTAAEHAPAEVLLFNDGRVGERYREKNIPVHIESENQSFFALAKACKARLEKRSPRLIVAHGYKEILVAWLCARGLKIPFIPVFHGRAEPHPGFAGVKLGFYEYLALFVARNFATAIICVSRALAKDLGLHGLSKLRVVYNSHTRSGSAEAPRTRAGIFSMRPAIYMIGRLVRVKRIDLALDVLKGFLLSGPAMLYVAGNGPEEAALVEKAKALGITEQAEFLGFREDATELIADADIFLLTSDSEGVPTVLLDAIWFGLPVVSTAVGGIPEVMSLFPGYPARLVPAGNRIELIRALEDCRREGVRDSAPKDRFQILDSLFSPRSAAAQYELAYQEAINAHGR